MSAGSKFARAFSLRDKKASNNKISIDNDLFSLEEGSKRLSKDEQQKIQDIQTRFSRLGNNNVPESRIQYALRSRSAQGDVGEATRLLLLYEDSIAGVLHRYDSSVKMLGAENWEKSTCWLDSLLFAMFAKTDVFEAVLHQQYADAERRKLVEGLRLWVNMLRSGKLITTDITKKLQQAIAECGWPDAAKPRQQDASEAFNFITDKLSLPLLTLKTDIYHQGKEDANDDHKFITERMLDVAIPENLPQGEILKLEFCLEDYFNNRVEVKRHLARRQTLDATTAGRDEKAGSAHVEVSELDKSTPGTPLPTEDPIARASAQRPLHMRNRATSIFSERKVLTSKTELQLDGDTKDEKQQAGKKEVLMPAWQFLNLIPWYTDNVPENDSQVRAHFSHKRLMLGICLKRYAMTAKGVPYRLGTHIDIPLEMASPHFTTGDEIDREGTNASKFKLVLKSFVCHRGQSVEAGHYISFVRVEVAKHHDSGTALSNDTPDHTQAQGQEYWLKFDDLASERVTLADINKALKDEIPYLLFYRVQPIDEHLPEETPPPYQESDASLDYVDQKLKYLEDDSRASLDQPLQPSGRPSVEISAVTSPEDARGRPSMDRRSSKNAPSSTGSIGMEPASTRGTSPSNTTYVPSPTVSRQPTKAMGGSKSDPTGSGRPSSDDTGRRSSLFMSKLAARLSRDKLNSPDIVVNEITDDAAQNHAVPRTEDNVETLVPAKAKTKESNHKKSKFKMHSRRGSDGKGLDKPDRECNVM